MAITNKTLVTLRLHKNAAVPRDVSSLGPDMIEANLRHERLHQLHTEGVVSERRRAATWRLEVEPGRRRLHLRRWSRVKPI